MSPRSRSGRTVTAFRKALEDNLYFTHGSAIHSASPHDAYMAIAYTVRDHLVERWRRTTDAQMEANPRFVYYLSAEYLLGRQLERNMLYTDLLDLARRTLKRYGLDLETFLELDPEPGLGNGGLGRLVACFLDSLATLDIPAVGYGIRYEFGIFRQTIVDGWQVERPDEWAKYGYPWEFPQSDDMVPVHFGGHTEHWIDDAGRECVRWTPAHVVMGEPCTNLVPGFQTTTVNTLRLWRARASEEFDFQLFDVGDYERAVGKKIESENISKVLYPNDNTPQGRELRLKQQYFFVACSIRDIIRRFRLRNSDWDEFANKVAIQLNDTHPVIGIPELMRILVDEEELDWDRAWDITVRSFAYTCHTLLPEALEKWPVGLLEHLLPRHLEIIYRINDQLIDEVRERWPGDEGRIRRMSLVEEGEERQIRMAHLATVGSFSVNGVAELHSRLLRERTLAEFAEMWPNRFGNKTNGVTPRRFVWLANPRLAALLDSRIGPGWRTELEELRRLEPLADDLEFQKSWRRVKASDKRQLAQLIQEQTGVTVDPRSMFDVMVKRLHEYKRQLLMLLEAIARYQRICDGGGRKLAPRTCIFAAKAAPGYHMAKLIIKLIHSVAEVVNHDPLAKDRLRIVFLPNFNVSLGEQIYPAADLSEQISLAGMEASGTGNMKFALNGAVTIGTLDGANIEILERVGAENFFSFGMTVEQVHERRESGYDPAAQLEILPELTRVIDSIARGDFSGGDPTIFSELVDSLVHRDEYMVVADYPSYAQTQERVAVAFRDRARWTRMSILNSARCGFFSSDRAMREYCRDIWRVEPLRVEARDDLAV